jgi:tetratricopeptide (TPR) repeat protein
MAIDRQSICERARFLERQGSFDEAIRAWMMILSEFPDDDRAMLMLGHLHERRGDQGSASIWFERCGDYYVGAGFPQKAAAVYIHAASIDPSSLTAGVKGADLLRRLGHPRKAVETLKALADACAERGAAEEQFAVMCLALAIACPNGMRIPRA